MTDDVFAYYAAAAMDDGKLDVVLIDIKHLCPEREADVTSLQGEVGSVMERCRNPVTEADRQVREAVGGQC